MRIQKLRNNTLTSWELWCLTHPAIISDLHGGRNVSPPIIILVFDNDLAIKNMFSPLSLDLFNCFVWMCHCHISKALYYMRGALESLQKMCNNNKFKFSFKDNLGWTNSLYRYMLSNFCKNHTKIASTPTFDLYLSTLKYWFSPQLQRPLAFYKKKRVGQISLICHPGRLCNMFWG